MSQQLKPLKIVNASAGSGKTYTLVQEYLAIVLRDKNPARFRNILAMTFTNKAANEMKTRILEALIDLGTPAYKKTQAQSDFLQQTASNHGLKDLQFVETHAARILNQILHNYSAFSVMTIDKFTHRIIRTFARDLDIAVDFDVELDIRSLRKNVTDLLFDQIGRDSDLTLLMMRYANTNLSQDKSWNFSEQLFEFSDLLFREDAIKSISLLRNLSTEDFLKIQTDLQKETAILKKQLEQNALEFVELCQSKGLSESDFVLKTRSVLSYFKRVLLSNYDPPSDSIQKNVNEGKWLDPKSPNSGLATELNGVFEKYYAQHLQALDTIPGKLLINEEILKNLNNLSLLNHLLSLLEGMKEEQNILLISDFYKKIAEVIRDEKVPFIYERMGVRYEYFLLDEFQDTSHLQWVNMIPLIHNSLSSGRKNLIVGDGKQAIYRWRNGEVEQFTNLPSRIHNPEKIASLFEAEKLFAELGEKTDLEKNFRSAPLIVEFNNDLFSSLGENLDGSLKYIYERVRQIPVKKHQGYIEMNLVPSMKDEEQLMYVLDCVNRACENGFSWKDICVLVRKNKEGSLIADYLTAHGKKVISPDSLFIGKDQHVKLLVSIMHASARPFDRNSRIKSLEHLADLILKVEPGTIVQKYPVDSEKDDTIESIFQIHGIAIKSYTQFENIYEYAMHLVRTLNLDLLRNPYIQFFLEEVHAFEKRTNSSIREFLEWYESKGYEESIVSPEGANAIQVMTIFKAKGLQFPVVICPFMDWKADINRQVNWVEDESGKLPAYFLKMREDLKETNHASVYKQELAKFKLDQLNLVYVAFTRPETALFICGDASAPSSPASWWLKGYQENLNWTTDEQSKKFRGTLVAPVTQKTKQRHAIFEIKEPSVPLPKLSYSFKSGQTWDLDLSENKREFGNKLHLVLSKLHDQAELGAVIQQLKAKGLLDSEQASAVMISLESLFRDSHFAGYFGNKAYAEKEILTPAGQKLIPDRILVRENETVVVDFKTGQEDASHESQVTGYLKALQEMGMPAPRGEIYYTELQKVIKVSLS